MVNMQWWFDVSQVYRLGEIGWTDRQTDRCLSLKQYPIGQEWPRGKNHFILFIYSDKNTWQIPISQWIFQTWELSNDSQYCLIQRPWKVFMIILWIHGIFWLLFVCCGCLPTGLQASNSVSPICSCMEDSDFLPPSTNQGVWDNVRLYLL